MSEPIIGRQIGSYIIEEELGRGRVGAIYRARHATVSRTAAVRRIDCAQVHDPVVRRRLISEYQVLDRLRPEFVVAVYDLQVHGDEIFVVMELVEGQTLADRLRLGPLPIEEVATLVEQLLQGLSIAHRAGLVHGTLSPDELILSSTGVRILDLGLAPVRSMPTLHQAVDPLAPERFVAPEVWLGRPEAKADVYGVGICCYAALTGGVPDLVGATDQDEVPDVRVDRPDTPAWLAAVIFYATRQDPNRRYHDAGDMRRAVLAREPGDELPGVPDLGTQPPAGGEVESTQVSVEAFPGIEDPEERTPAQAASPFGGVGEPESTQFVPHEVTPVEAPPPEDERVLAEVTPVEVVPDPGDLELDDDDLVGAAPYEPAPADEWALEAKTKVEAAPYEPAPADEWALEAKTKVEAAPYEPAPAEEWAFDAKTTVEPAPTKVKSGPEAPRGGAAAPRREPAPAPPRSPFAGCGIAVGLGGLVLATLICALALGLTDWGALGEVVGLVGTAEEPKVETAGEGQEPPAEAALAEAAAAEAAVAEAAAAEAAVAEAAAAEAAAAEEAAAEAAAAEAAAAEAAAEAAAASRGSSGSTRSSGGSSSSGGRSSGGAAEEPEEEPVAAEPTGPRSGRSEGSTLDEAPAKARLVVMATADRRKKLKDLLIIVDEKRVGPPPVNLDVRPGAHMIEWKGDGFHHICPVEVGTVGRTVKMDLDDPSCP